MVGFATLFASQDPEVLQYAHNVATAGTQKGHESQAKSGFKDLTQGIRDSEKSKKGILWRLANPNSGEPTEVLVICKTCMSEESKGIDAMPMFSIKTNRYVCRDHPCCPVCEATAQQAHEIRVGPHAVFCASGMEHRKITLYREDFGEVKASSNRN